jgi:hypothetical protein
MVLNICNVRENGAGQIRRPNPEIRKKSELRNPKATVRDVYSLAVAAGACGYPPSFRASIAGRVKSLRAHFAGEQRLPAPDSANLPLPSNRASAPSSFGFRPSDFFRISGFGLRISRRFSFLLATIPSGLHDIQDPVPIPDPWRWVWIGALIAALFALALYAWLRPRKPAPAPYVRVIPPHEKARKALLDALELIDEPREFCILVSDALRVYLDERFTLGAPEKTTEEFLTELQVSSVLSEEQKDILEDFLNRCDLVKFARYEPREPELRALYDSALRLISETEPREIILPAATVSAPNQ